MKTRRSRATPKQVAAQRAAAARLRANGWTLSAIGVRLGLHRQRVHQLLKPVRPNGCRACGRPVGRPRRYHPACLPSGDRPSGVRRGPKGVDLAGRVCGWWTVVRRGTGGRWVCRCRCGVERSVRGGHLRGGTSRSCRGCAADRRRGEGLRRTGGGLGEIGDLAV